MNIKMSYTSVLKIVNKIKTEKLCSYVDLPQVSRALNIIFKLSKHCSDWLYLEIIIKIIVFVITQMRNQQNVERSNVCF